MQVYVGERSVLLLAAATKSRGAWKASLFLRLYRYSKNLSSYKNVKVHVVDLVTFLSVQQAPKHS